MQFGTVTSTDELDLNWQRLALTNAMERDHLGVLTGSPITDVRITLTGGRAHAKHTEGGDFRQATYRAIRQGLMQAREAGAAVLLEPWYHFELEVPGECVGRALSDATRMGAEYEPPTMAGDRAKLVGRVPTSEVQDYALEVAPTRAVAGICTWSSPVMRPVMMPSASSRRRLRARGRSAQHARFGLLRPRRRLHGQMVRRTRRGARKGRSRHLPSLASGRRRVFRPHVTKWQSLCHMLLV